MPSSNNTDEAIAQLKSLALKAKAAGDMTKAKEYLIQMKVCILIRITRAFNIFNGFYNL